MVFKINSICTKHLELVEKLYENSFEIIVRVTLVGFLLIAAPLCLNA